MPQHPRDGVISAVRKFHEATPNSDDAYDAALWMADILQDTYEIRDEEIGAVE